MTVSMGLQFGGGIHTTDAVAIGKAATATTATTAAAVSEAAANPYPYGQHHWVPRRLANQ